MILHKLLLPGRHLKALQPFVWKHRNARILENISSSRQIHGSVSFGGSRPKILTKQSLKSNIIRNPCMMMASDTKSSSKADKITDGSVLVYSNNFKKSLFITHIGATAVTPLVCAFGVSPFLQYYDNLSEVFVKNTSNIVGPIGSAMFGLFLYGAVSVLVNRTMVRLYYNEDTEKFTGVYYNMFFKKIKIVFDNKDTAPLTVGGFLGELGGNTSIRGRPFFFVLTDFSSPSYYNKLMGFTKD